ncbi:MAG: heavy-metal-associated domain-containing protein, partial [Bacteroidota bacterium]
NKDEIKRAEFKVSGMTCQGCAEHIMHEVNKLAGVLRADASYEKGNAVVDYIENKTSASEIADAINSTGYKVEKISENDK